MPSRAERRAERNRDGLSTTLNRLFENLNTEDLSLSRRRREIRQVVHKTSRRFVENEYRVTPDVCQNLLVDLARNGLDSVLAEELLHRQGFQGWDDALDKTGMDTDGAIIEVSDGVTLEARRTGGENVSWRWSDTSEDDEWHARAEEMDEKVSQAREGKRKRGLGYFGRETLKDVAKTGITGALSFTALVGVGLISAPLAWPAAVGAAAGGLIGRGIARYVNERKNNRSKEGTWEGSGGYKAASGLVRFIAEKQELARTCLEIVNTDTGLEQKDKEQLMCYTLNQIVAPSAEAHLIAVKEWRKKYSKGKLWELLGGLAGSAIGGGLATAGLKDFVVHNLKEKAATEGIRIAKGHLVNNGFGDFLSRNAIKILHSMLPGQDSGHLVQLVNGHYLFQLDPADAHHASQFVLNGHAGEQAKQLLLQGKVDQAWEHVLHGVFNLHDPHLNQQVAEVWKHTPAQYGSFADFKAAVTRLPGLPFSPYNSGFLSGHGINLYHQMGPGFGLTDMLTRDYLSQGFKTTVAMMGALLAKDTFGLVQQGREERFQHRVAEALLSTGHTNLPPEVQRRWAERLKAGRAAANANGGGGSNDAPAPGAEGAPAAGEPAENPDPAVEAAAAAEAAAEKERKERGEEFDRLIAKDKTYLTFERMLPSGAVVREYLVTTGGKDQEGNPIFFRSVVGREAVDPARDLHESALVSLEGGDYKGATLREKYITDHSMQILDDRAKVADIWRERNALAVRRLTDLEAADKTLHDHLKSSIGEAWPGPDSLANPRGYVILAGHRSAPAIASILADAIKMQGMEDGKTPDFKVVVGVDEATFRDDTVWDDTKDQILDGWRPVYGRLNNNHPPVPFPLTRDQIVLVPRPANARAFADIVEDMLLRDHQNREVRMFRSA